MSALLTYLIVFALIALAALTVAATTVQLIRSVREFRIGYKEPDDHHTFHSTL